MQAVKNTKAWTNNQAQQLTSEAFLAIEYNITDPNLPDVEKIDGHQALEFLPLKVYNEEQEDLCIEPYATLEPMRWRLDGSMSTIPYSANYEYCGYVHICDAAEAVASTTGGDEANSEKIMQPSTIIAPSRHTAA